MRRLLVALAIGWLGCSTTGDGPGSGGAGSGGTTGAGGAGGEEGPCAFATTYTIVDSRGFTPMQDTATLTPPSAFSYERASFVDDAGQPSCAPALPACHAPDQVDVSDVEEALASGDVQAAFAQSSFVMYGDWGIEDAPSFNVRRPDGHGFGIAPDCTAPAPTCTPIPPGILAARTLLRALISQQLADPSCAGFAAQN
jgi:hypothetical protein